MANAFATKGDSIHMCSVDPKDLEMIRAMRKSNEESASRQDPGLIFTLDSVREVSIPAQGRDIPVIIYKPNEPSRETLPVFINIHGGGFVMGRADMDGPYCRRIANRAHCVVVNVDYRLAPEHCYPAALEDCYDSVLWTYSHADELHINRSQIAIGGYSAGANLSAAVCLLAKQRGQFTICHQTLCYAPMDLTGGGKPSPVNCDAFPKEIESLFNRCYLGVNGDPRDPLVSPVYARSLSGLPPALIIVGERDGLLPSSETYAQMLRNSCVPVTYKSYKDMGHAFTHSSCPEANNAWELICHSLRAVFNGDGIR